MVHQQRMIPGLTYEVGHETLGIFLPVIGGILSLSFYSLLFPFTEQSALFSITTIVVGNRIR